MFLRKLEKIIANVGKKWRGDSFTYIFHISGPWQGSGKSNALAYSYDPKENVLKRVKSTKTSRAISELTNKLKAGGVDYQVKGQNILLAEGTDPKKVVEALVQNLYAYTKGDEIDYA